MLLFIAYQGAANRAFVKGCDRSPSDRQGISINRSPSGNVAAP
jgi:hypothetical protein